MSELLGALLFALFLIVALVAFFLVIGILFPNRVARSQVIAETMTGRALLVGGVNFLFMTAIILVLFALADQSGVGLLALPGLALLFALGVALSIGMAGLCQLVGARIAAERSPWRQVATGATVLSAASLLPIVGWFGLLPYIGVLGLGAFIISLIPTTSPPPPPSEPPSALP